MRKNWMETLFPVKQPPTVVMRWLFAAVLAGLPAVALADGKPDPGASTNGSVIYVRYCVSCHGKAGLGDGPLAKDLRVPVPDLTTLSARSRGPYPYERVVRIIENGEVLKGHGTADMPSWGDAFKRTGGTGTPCVDEAIKNLTHYIWSLQGQAPK
ncbi:MAG: c-type cytochrome [Vicinamibacteria bacterium]